MLHDILETFPGSQDGTKTETFLAGTQRELSAWLAPLAVSAGWARPVGAPIVENKAVVTDGRQTGTITMRRGRKGEIR